MSVLGEAYMAAVIYFILIEIRQAGKDVVMQE